MHTAVGQCSRRGPFCAARAIRCKLTLIFLSPCCSCSVGGSRRQVCREGEAGPTAVSRVPRYQSRPLVNPVRFLFLANLYRSRLCQPTPRDPLSSPMLQDFWANAGSPQWKCSPLNDCKPAWLARFSQM